MKVLIYKPLLFVTDYYCYTEKSQTVLIVPDNINLYRYVSHLVTILHMPDYKHIYVCHQDDATPHFAYHLRKLR